MTRYEIIGSGSVVLEDGGHILDATPPLADWAGQAFSTLRTFAERKGWIVRPLPSPTCTELYYKGTRYKFTWSDGVIIRMLRFDDEGAHHITVKDLPAPVRKAL